MGETQEMYDEICDGCEFQDSCDGDCTPDDCAHSEAWDKAHGFDTKQETSNMINHDRS